MPVRSSGTPDIRSVINSKQRKTFSKGRAGMASSREGELFTTMEGGRAYINYKKHGRLWKTPMSFDGNVYVDKNLYVEGTLRINNKTQFNNPINIGNAATTQKLSLNDVPVTQTAAQLNFVSTALVSGGIKTGATLGDGIESFVIYNDSSVAGTSDDNTVSASTIWQQTDDTAVIKIIFNYYHEAESTSMKLSCMLRTTASARAATATLAIYPFASGASLTTGSTANTSSAAVTPVTISSTRENFDSSSMLSSSKMDITGLTANTMYKATIALHNADAGATEVSHMTAPTVTIYGSA
jgi:hypothetical protein